MGFFHLFTLVAADMLPGFAVWPSVMPRAMPLIAVEPACVVATLWLVVGALAMLPAAGVSPAAVLPAARGARRRISSLAASSGLKVLSENHLACGLDESRCKEGRPDRRPDGGLVLIVDDDAIVLLGLQLTFVEWGWTVITATSADDAVAAMVATVRSPDLVIADYVLRGAQTGADVLRMVNARAGRTIPAIVLTGDTSPDRSRDAARDGYTLLHKPVSPAMLRRAVHTLTANPGAAGPGRTGP